MTTEVSAGCVIVRSLHAGTDVLLIRDMKGKLTFPKGIMEHGEDVEATATREAKEETGMIRLSVVAPLPDVTYIFTRQGKKVKKTVHYVLCTTTSRKKPVPQVEEGITEILWVPIENAGDVIGYRQSNMPVLAAAIDILRSSGPASRTQ